MKYRILIVDDEDSGRQALNILIEKVFWAYVDRIDFSSTFEGAQQKILGFEYDIIFLDINLKGISAFDLLRFIPGSSRVVFVTAYSEFMLQALRSKAFDYLVKPVKEEDLEECFIRILKENDSVLTNTSIQIKSKGITRIVNHTDIVYVEGDGPYSIFYLNNESIRTAKTIKLITLELSNSFVRIHKSFLVNRKYIKGFNMDTLILYNDIWLPVSRTGYKELCLL